MPVELPSETLEFFQNDELHARIFYEKYAIKDIDGNIIEKTPVEMWKRLAKEISSVEKDQKTYEEKFFWLLNDFKFVPGGRILFGTGSPRRATLLNCYYLPIKEDSIEGIFETAREMARTYSFGGGVGIDISVLRPKGCFVNNASIRTTGAVSFMELYSVTTGTIGQSGRRGALMITMDVHHPDIEDFIVAKSDKRSVRYANISVKVYNDFMHAVEENSDFELHFKNNLAEAKRKVNARVIWEKIIDTALNTGDPGIIFWDHVKDESPVEYDPRMSVKGTNPCAEQPLENYGACDLGAINLEYFVKDSFTKNANIDWKTLETTIRYSVRFLDNVLDYSYPRHALKAQAEQTVYTRRIGLGVMGLANMLIRLNIKYDTDAAIKFVDEFFGKFKEIAYDESSNIAKEKGSFKGFNAEEHVKRNFIKRLSSELKKKIKAQGLRNGAVLTIAPTGSISSMIGVSGGVEPIYALSYTRRSESLSEEKFEILDPIVKTYMNEFKLKEKRQLPDIFVVAHAVDPFFRVKMQATIQKHIDSSISSTVNLKNDTGKDTVNKIYIEAWKQGCKSITIYREGSKEDILTATDEAGQQPPPEKIEAELSELEERPFIMQGTTIKFPLPQGNLYVTVNKGPNDAIKEVFISMGRSGEAEKTYTEAIGRLISVYLQSGGNVERIINTLKGIRGDTTVWFNGIRLLSLPDAVAKGLELVEKGAKITTLKGNEQTENLKGKIEPVSMTKRCPSCLQDTLIFENGCFVCKSCGYTKCE